MFSRETTFCLSSAFTVLSSRDATAMLFSARFQISISCRSSEQNQDQQLQTKKRQLTAGLGSLLAFLLPPLSMCPCTFKFSLQEGKCILLPFVAELHTHATLDPLEAPSVGLQTSDGFEDPKFVQVTDP